MKTSDNKKFDLLYTTIVHHARLKYKITNNDYCIANAIYHLSNNPDSRYKGWYFGKIETLGKMFGFSRATAYNCVQKLIDKELVYRDDETRFLKTTKRWWNDFVNNAVVQQSKK